MIQQENCRRVFLIKMGKRIAYAWKNCSNPDCRVRMRKIWKYKDQIFCFTCYQKQTHKMPESGNNLIKLKEALSKVYEIRGYKHKKDNSITAYKNFPSILIGHKVKLILIK